MDTTNTLDNSLEKSWDEVLNLVNFADLKDLLQLGEEESLLDTVGEWPVFEKTLKERDG